MVLCTQLKLLHVSTFIVIIQQPHTTVLVHLSVCLSVCLKGNIEVAPCWAEAINWEVILCSCSVISSDLSIYTVGHHIDSQIYNDYNFYEQFVSFQAIRNWEYYWERFLFIYGWWSQQQMRFLTFLNVLLVSSCIEKQRNTTDCRIAHHIPWWYKWKWTVIIKTKLR